MGGVTVQKNQRGCRGVMLVHHAGGEGTFSLLELFQYGGGNDHPLAYAGKGVGGDGTGTQEGEIFAAIVSVDLDYGGFKTDIALSAVNDHVHPPRKIGDDVTSLGGGGLSRQIGRGSGHWEVTRRKKGVGNGMIGTAHGYRVQSARGGVGDAIPLGKHHRQGSRHEGGGQAAV